MLPPQEYLGSMIDLEEEEKRGHMNLFRWVGRWGWIWEELGDESEIIKIYVVLKTLIKLKKENVHFNLYELG